MKLNIVFLIISGLAFSALAQECLPDDDRIDCHPDANATPARCEERGCTWCDTSDPSRNTPTCFFPRDWGYRMVGEPVNTGHGFQVNLERVTTSTVFGGDANELVLEADFQSDYRLRLKITDDKPRFEVPLAVGAPSTNLTDNPLYDIEFANDPVFSFKVVRKATGAVLMDTSLGGFNFADQYIQIGYKLPTKDVYGIGENEQHSLRHSFENRPMYGLYADGRAPSGNANLYGVYPTYTVLEEDGSAHQVLILNSDAQEFEMHPSPGIVYKTIGGLLDIYIFLGPTPENTAQQYTEAVGRLPLVPYWALGFHVCRHGYVTIEGMQTVVDRMIASEIPYDTQWGDIDIFDRNLDFTVSNDRFPGLTEYIKELKTRGLKFITILDPCISTVETPGTYRPYELGQEMDIWVTRADGVTPTHGKVWPDGVCYFPDFAKNETKEWWKILMKEYHDELVEFDAMWIDMNEPANFADGDYTQGCLESSLNNPPYFPRSIVGGGNHQTICPDDRDIVSSQYDTHNLYAWFQAEPTLLGAREAVGKRTFVLSRASFIGLGRWAAHWLGDNFSTWDNMFYSIIGVLQFNLFGVPFVGPDICGHNGAAATEMCQRWQELGAFHPFSRNHNAYGNQDQDPAAFDGQIIESTKKAMTVRYTLLPYLYTLLARHERWGDTVARAMWSVFPTDSVARGVDRQFFWGTGLLISPVLEEGAVTVEAYFPDARFYDYYTGEEVTTRGNHTVLQAPLDHIPVHVHGGTVIPTQEPAVNTELSRNNPFGLIVALDDDEEASGSFYFDDGESFDPLQTLEYFLTLVTASNKTITAASRMNQYEGMASKVINTIRLLGIASPPTTMTVNGQPHTNFTVLPSKEVFIQYLNLVANEDFTLSYN